MPTPDDTKIRYGILYDETGAPINAGNPLPVNPVSSITKPDNVRVIDRYNEEFLNLLLSLWDGAPLTLADWAKLFDGDPSTFQNLTASLQLVFPVPLQVDEMEVIDQFGADVLGGYFVFTPAGDVLLFAAGGKASPKCKVSAIIFIPDAPPVKVAELVIKGFTHVATFPETDFAFKDESLLGPGGVTMGSFFPTMPKARIVGICKISDGLNTATARLRIIQSFDGITDDYISEFLPKDTGVGNPVVGSGLGYSVEVIAPYARFEILNTGPAMWTAHRTFAYVRGAP